MLNQGVTFVLPYFSVAWQMQNPWNRTSLIKLPVIPGIMQNKYVHVVKVRIGVKKKFNRFPLFANVSREHFWQGIASPREEIHTNTWIHKARRGWGAGRGAGRGGGGDRVVDVKRFRKEKVIDRTTVSRRFASASEVAVWTS